MTVITKLTIGLATAALLALPACSGGAASQEGPVDLRMTIWSANEKHLALFNAIGEAYVAANPDKVSSIKFDSLTNDYVSSLTTQVAGNDVPDLVWVAEANATEFVDSGVLYDVRPTLENTDEYALDDVLPNALDLWKSKDGLYAYPFSNSPFGVYVNTGLISAAGQPNPADLLAQGKWTWDEAMKISAAASAKAGAATGGLVVGSSPFELWDGLTPLWIGWGARPWSEDGKKCTMNSPEMTSFYEWFHDQVFTKNATPKPGEEFSFASGGAVMQVAQLSSSGGIEESVKWDYLPLPAGPAGQVDIIGQAGVGVVAKGKNPEIAADFLAYFTNPTNSAKLAQFFPPPRKSLLNVETLSAAAPKLNPDQLKQTVVDSVPGAETKAGNRVYSQINRTIQSDLDTLWKANADVSGTLSRVCSDIGPKLTGR